MRCSMLRKIRRTQQSSQTRLASGSALGGPAKKSIRLCRLNFPDHRHPCAGESVGSDAIPNAGAPNDLRDWISGPSFAPCSSNRRRSPWRTLHSTINCWSFSDPSSDPGSPNEIGSSGSGYPACGRVGATTSSSFSPLPSSPGTGEGSGSTGGGGPGTHQSAARGSTPNFALSSSAWCGRTHLGPTPHPSGTRPSRLHRGRADRRQVHAEDVAAALPDVRAFLPTHAREIIAVDFYPRANLDISLAVRLHRASPRPPRTHLRQRHGSSHGPLGRAPTHRELTLPGSGLWPGCTGSNPPLDAPTAHCWSGRIFCSKLMQLSASGHRAVGM